MADSARAERTGPPALTQTQSWGWWATAQWQVTGEGRKTSCGFRNQ